MTKLVFAAAVALATLTAAPAFAFGNPASALCERYRGELIAVYDDYGNAYNLCALPDGHIIEEWTLLRMREEQQPIYVYPQDGHGHDNGYPG